ncbi:MAG: hypothetical protein KatS3mg008_0503 [Acidimicrobiales bacterium]|nr:MAG: hypothetical protein KatS3mg008_0503 [Acidimicrobiales bacterium]
MSDPGFRIEVTEEQNSVAVDVPRLVETARRVLDAEGVPFGAFVGVRLVEPEVISELNESYMGRSGPTDVLSFPIDGPDLSGRARSPGAPPSVAGPTIIGDLVICPKVAEENARSAGHDVSAELDLLVVHGLLHLLGWSHDHDDDTDLMRRRERELLGEAI